MKSEWGRVLVRGNSLLGKLAHLLRKHEQLGVHGELLSLHGHVLEVHEVVQVHVGMVSIVVVFCNGWNVGGSEGFKVSEIRVRKEGQIEDVY